MGFLRGNAPRVNLAKIRLGGARFTRFIFVNVICPRIGGTCGGGGMTSPSQNTLIISLGTYTVGSAMMTGNERLACATLHPKLWYDVIQNKGTKIKRGINKLHLQTSYGAARTASSIPT